MSLFSAGLFGPDIPDSAIAQYDATQITASDGSTLSSLTDQIGTFDLSGSDPVYLSGGINGNPALDFTNDVLSESNITITQPFTVISLFSHDDTASRHIYSSSTKRSPSIEGSQTGDDLTNMTGGADILGQNTQLSPVIYTGVFDGASSILRENATQTASGDGGSESFDGLRIGNGPQGAGDGQFGELVVYDAALSSSDISSEEQRIADKFGITL